MKNFRFPLLTVALLAAMIVSASAQTKVATVDMKKIFNGYYKTKLAQASLKNREAQLTKEIKEMAEGLEKNQTSYKQLLDQANDQAISAEEREKRKQAAADKAKEIASSRTAVEQFQRQAKAQLDDQTQRMSVNLVTEIQKAVADKAKAGNYSLVLNAGTVEVVVFAGSETDLTAPVLAQLNAGAPIDVTAPGASMPFNTISTISTNLP
jgi:outer membrane protein